MEQPIADLIFTFMNKLSYYILCLAFAAVSCSKSADHSQHENDPAEKDSTNIILYNQVMDIHDEVMPKMEDLYNKKKNLEDQLNANPSADAKAKLQTRIAEVDSASKMMMDWMHEFDPPADSAAEDTKRAYLESEMEKVKLVKEAILAALDSTKNP